MPWIRGTVPLTGGISGFRNWEPKEAQPERIKALCRVLDIMGSGENGSNPFARARSPYGDDPDRLHRRPWLLAWAAREHPPIWIEDVDGPSFYREQDHTEGRLAAELLRRLLIAGSTFPPRGAGERGSLTSGQRRLPAKKSVLLSVFVVALC